MQNTKNFLKYSGYQTILLPNGEIIPGLFPTLKWFEEIKTMIDFREKRILDLGSNDGMFSILSLADGAYSAEGIEKDFNKINTSISLAKKWGFPYNVILGNIEDTDFSGPFNVIFFNMILHWLKNPPEQLKRIAALSTNFIVIIYRKKNSFYKPENGNWFPDQEELDSLLPDFRSIYENTVMTQDNGKEVVLTIYKRLYPKKILRHSDLVSKKSPMYDFDWRKKIDKIRGVIELPVLYDTTDNGYMANFINGIDLHGDTPFNPSHVPGKELQLNKKERFAVIKLFTDIILSGIKSSYFLVDFTKRNVILCGNKAFIIDISDIVSAKHIPTKYYQVIQLMLDYLKIDYKFDGSLENLYERLIRLSP